MTDGSPSPPDGHLVHGLEREPAAPDWAPIVVEELREALAPLDLAVDDLEVEWRSPRPMSAAAVVRAGAERVFVKRHDHRVRETERLAREHRLGDHLRARGVATPRVRRGPGGASVVERDDQRYECFDLAAGEDRYRDVPSWYPYLDPAHAYRSGAALARFHRAAADFAEPADPVGVLADGLDVVGADDLDAALTALLARRPGLARALAPYDLDGDVDRVLRRPVERARDVINGRERQWTHGDWHPSNLTWDPAGDDVAEVLDLGLANRTDVVHDLAVAIERAVVDWLDQAGRGAITVDVASLDALLAGYDEVAPLGRGDRVALAAVLPVAHLEFALSEVEYFGDVLGAVASRDLAYHGYLLGHAEWFAGPAGRALLDRVASAAWRPTAARGTMGR